MNALFLPKRQGAGIIGIDLAGVPHRETGIAILRGGALVALAGAGDDAAILGCVAAAGAGALIAINAPLTIPRGRCCLDDDCPCRYDPGTRSRAVEREMLRRKIPILATALIKVLARRGQVIGAALRERGYSPLEVYPHATLRLLDLPHAGKRTALGRRRIYRALQEIVPGLDHPKATEHQLDAVVCALTGQLWQRGLTIAVGDPDEGTMVIPSAAAAEALRVGDAPARQIAEEGRGTGYRT